MLALRFNGAHRMNQLRSGMDRLFENACEGFPRMIPDARFVRAFPALNVWEDEDNVFAEAELPGVKLEDIELLIADNELTIKGERKCACEEGVSYHRKERGMGCFDRSFELPIEVDADKVEATLRDGVLMITMPKAETVKPRKVEVKSQPG